MSTTIATLDQLPQDDIVKLEKMVLEKRPLHEVARTFKIKYPQAVALVKCVRDQWPTSYADRKTMAIQLEAELEHLRGKAYEMLEAPGYDDEFVMSPKDKLAVINTLAKLIEQHAAMIGKGGGEEEPERRVEEKPLVQLTPEQEKQFADLAAQALSMHRKG